MHAADDTAGGPACLLTLADESATLALGALLARTLRPGLVIFLQGDLGAGKTTLTRGLLRGLGYAGRVKSPTYTLVEPYTISNLYLYHFDLYRFNNPYEWEEAGFHEHFNPTSVCLIEWPEKAAVLLPKPDLCIRLADSGTGRQVEISAASEAGQSCLTNLTRQLPEP